MFFFLSSLKHRIVKKSIAHSYSHCRMYANRPVQYLWRWMMMTLTLPYLKVQPDSPLREPFLQPAGLATAHGWSLWKSILKIKPNINDIIIWGSQQHCHLLISYIFCVAIFHHISTFCYLVCKSNPVRHNWIEIWNFKTRQLGNKKDVQLVQPCSDCEFYA